jgi:hypothetical protein
MKRLFLHTIFYPGGYRTAFITCDQPFTLVAGIPANEGGVAYPFIDNTHSAGIGVFTAIPGAWGPHTLNPAGLELHAVFAVPVVALCVATESEYRPSLTSRIEVSGDQ